MPELTPETPLYTISVASRLLGLHQQTLRMYERLGLVSPARVSGRVRLYSQADIEEVEYILYLVRERHVNLAGVRLILEIADSPEAARENIRKRRSPAGETDNAKNENADMGE